MFLKRIKPKDGKKRTCWARVKSVRTARGPHPLIEEFARIKTNDVVLPTSNGCEVRIRCATQTDASQRTLLGRLGLKIPTRLGQPQWSPDSQM